jgi:hypothetical protein
MTLQYTQAQGDRGDDHKPKIQPLAPAEFYYYAGDDQYHVWVWRWVRVDGGEWARESVGYVAVNGQGAWSPRGVAFICRCVGLETVQPAREAWNRSNGARVWYWRPFGMAAYRALDARRSSQLASCIQEISWQVFSPSIAIPMPERLLTRLENVRTSKGGWTANCPAHPDKNAALSIWIGKHGNVGLKCAHRCSVRKILKAAGLPAGEPSPAPGPVRGDEGDSTPSVGGFG